MMSKDTFLFRLKQNNLAISYYSQTEMVCEKLA